jgi:hypothetical protein
VTGGAVDLIDGVLVLAVPQRLAAGLHAAIRGAIELLGPPNASQVRPSLGMVWEDFVSARGFPPSYPNMRVYKGWQARLIIAGSGMAPGTATRVSALVGVDAEAEVAPGYVHRGPELSAIGDLFTSPLANPAAGASYAEVVEGAHTVSRLNAAQTTLVTGAAANTRYPRVRLRDPLSIDVGGGSVSRGQNPSQTVAWRWGRGPGHATNEPTNNPAGGGLGATLPESLIQPGWGVTFGADFLDGADDFAAGQLSREQWAVIL